MSLSFRGENEKRNVRTLRQYARKFNLKEPYKIIVGPYFCQLLADKKLRLKKSLESIFLDRDCEFYTTRCCINELQKKINKGEKNFIAGAHILRTLQKLPCCHYKDKNVKNETLKYLKKTKDTFGPRKKEGHWGKCVGPMRCLQPHILQKEYCFALQPKAYLQRVRVVAGCPSMWMKDGVIVLDKPSKASLAAIELMKNAEQKPDIGSGDEDDVKSFLADENDESAKKIKDSKQSNANKSAKKRNPKKRAFTEPQIKYTENGGFTTVGVRMKKQRKRQRTRRKSLKKTHLGPDEFGPRAPVKDDDSDFEVHYDEMEKIAGGKKKYPSYWNRQTKNKWKNTMKSSDEKDHQTVETEQ